MSAPTTTKESLAQARVRMEKAVDDFRKDLSTVRTGRASVSLLDSVRGGLSRNGDAAEPAWYGQHSGCDDDCGGALGSWRASPDRQGDPRSRPGFESDERR